MANPLFLQVRAGADAAIAAPFAELTTDGSLRPVARKTTPNDAPKAAMEAAARH